MLHSSKMNTILGYLNWFIISDLQFCIKLYFNEENSKKENSIFYIMSRLYHSKNVLVDNLQRERSLFTEIAIIFMYDTHS